MNEKIEAIEALMRKLDAQPFDFEAWKAGARIVLLSIFKEEPENVRLIEELDYEYSSWAMRDHQGGKQHDPVVMKAKEILQAFIISLKISNNSERVAIRSLFTEEEIKQLHDSYAQEDGYTVRKEILRGIKKDRLIASLEKVMKPFIIND